MSATTEVTEEDLHVLLKVFGKKSFEAGSCEEGSLEADITRKCECLFKQDYTIVELDNTNGVLSPRYPGRIFIPEHEHGHMTNPTTSNASPLNSNTNDSLNNATSSSDSPNTTDDIRAYLTFADTAMQQNQQQIPNTKQQNLMQQTSTSNASTTNGGLTNTTSNTIYEDSYDVGKIRDLIPMAKYARCRQRFVVPVLMYRGNFVCRSATISINAETYGRKVVDYAYDCLTGTNYSESGVPSVDDENNDNNGDSLMYEQSPFSYEEVIKSDIQLLNALNVTTIVDLMVEMRKVKYFMTVSSSEKADPENHYENFNILSLPYPGCEFFKKFRDHNYTAEKLQYDWDQPFNDATVSIPKLHSTNELNINWKEYKSWNLVLLTQNYMKVCLKYIKEEKKGLLIHCISGWDRTPLFISLVRISLWADGLIHQSLNPFQMVYFTLAYDWYLFGHQLPDRLKREEDIMLFCFNVLKFFISDEFSIVEESRKRTKTTSSSGSGSGSGSIVLNKSDSFDEEPKEDYISGCEQDSNESFSNSSNCDMSMADSYYATVAPSTPPHNPLHYFLAGNPLTKCSPSAKRTKTSPILVPGARQRHESTSSTGSWLCVNDAGSVDSTINGSFLHKHHDTNTSNESDNTCSGGNNSNNCSNAPNNSSNNSATKATVNFIRKQRLNAVRAIFINSYGKSVGLQFNEGSGLSLKNVVGTLY